MRSGARWALGTALVFMFGWAYAEGSETPTTKVSTVVVSDPIPFETVYELSRDVAAGRMRKVKEGVPGAIKKTYRITHAGEKVVKKELIGTEKIEPIHETIWMGKAGFTASRSGTFSRTRVLTMEATAYDPSAGRGKAATFRTATGRRAEFGVVAVDPKVIPLNTLVYVEGYGFALACDKGSAIKGNKIDLCFNTYAEVKQFGRRKVRVHILKPR